MARVLDEHLDLPAVEAARIRARDRRRSPRMVLDNAGVKRLLLDRARAQATAQLSGRPSHSAGGGPPPRQ